MALQFSLPPITIVTDYEHPMEGWRRGPDSYTQAGAKGGEAWKLFWIKAKEYGLPNITIRQVPAHKPYSAVGEGLITYAAWVGNRKADEMARHGALQHPSNRRQVGARRARPYPSSDYGGQVPRTRKCPREDQRK